MPRVSAFYGIVITMYLNEGVHPGRSHFHAQYAGIEASFDIETLEPIVGRLPRRVRRLVLKWARLHQDELRRNWMLLRSGRRPIPIAPCREGSTLKTMRATPRAVEARPTDGYRVWVRFEDGLAADVDFSDMVRLRGTLNDPLRDPEYFRQVDIYPGGFGIFWPNEADVCPDTLYRRARRAAVIPA